MLEAIEQLFGEGDIPLTWEVDGRLVHPASAIPTPDMEPDTRQDTPSFLAKGWNSMRRTLPGIGLYIIGASNIVGEHSRPEELILPTLICLVGTGEIIWGIRSDSSPSTLTPSEEI